MERRRIIVSEEDQQSPVALVTRNAKPLSVPPLQWYQYESMPDEVSARNTGFTVLVQANYKSPSKVPNLSSGPLSGHYTFSQIHFHWGSQDTMGSGHSVDGVRYPLEMHVVHVKNNLANLGEAIQEKDGIAIAVHLFALSEQRNTRLDQLTAVLQFIKENNSSASLYPSSLAELACPFSEDYFVYRGAVTGLGQLRYRIVWLVSKRVLTVSSQQLQQFRRIKDDNGKCIYSNANSPHQLGDRSLYLISPSEKGDRTISQRPTKSAIKSESKESVEILNTEFKSLVALEDAGICAIRPHPDHAQKSREEHPLKIRKGDTSVEESCIYLDKLHGSEFLEKSVISKHEELTKIVRVTKTKTYNLEYFPPKDSILAEGRLSISCEPIVKKSDPSTEQACMSLVKSNLVHSTTSAPAVTTWGYLGKSKECTDVSDQQKRNNSSEMVIFKKSLESLGNKKHKDSKKSVVFDEATIARTQGPSLLRNFQDAEANSSKNKMVSKGEYTSLTLLRQSPVKEREVTEIESKGNRCDRGGHFNEGKYFLVKQEAEPKKSFYRVIGELLMAPESKRTYLKHEQNTNEKLLTEKKDKSKHCLTKKDSSVNLLHSALSPHSDDISENNIEENSDKQQSKNVSENNTSDKLIMSSNSKIILGKHSSKSYISVKGMGEETSKKYYVTRITPIRSQQTNHEETAGKKIFYAKSLRIKSEVTNGRPHQLNMSTSNKIDGMDDENPKNINDAKSHLPETQCLSKYIDKHNPNVEKNVMVDKGTSCTFKFSSPKCQKSTEQSTYVTILQNQKVIEDSAPDKQAELSKVQQNNSNKNKNIKLAISFKSQKTMPDYKNQKEDLKFDEKYDIKINNITANNGFQSNNNVKVLEELEENTVHMSEQTKKQIRIRVTTPTYKIANPPSTVNKQPSSRHLVTIQKVEIPDPFYLRRSPRNPMVQYEAYQTGRDQHATEEMITEEKTVETYTSTKTANKKITVKGNPPRGSFYDHKHIDTKTGEVKNTRIMIGSYIPSFLHNHNSLTDKENKLKESKLSNGNDKSDQLRIIFQPSQQSLLFGHKNESTNLHTNISSDHREESYKNFVGKEADTVKDKIDKNEGLTADPSHNLGRNYVDVSTSNPLNSFIIASQNLPNQPSQVQNYSDILEEPTKDPGFHSFIKGNNLSYPSKEETIRYRVPTEDKSTDMEHNLPSKEQSIKIKSNLNSGSIVFEAGAIYPYQPQGDLSSSIKQSSLHRQENVSDNRAVDSPENQQGKTSVLKTSKNISPPILAKSEEVSGTPNNSEEFISTHHYADDERSSDSSYCKVTFKSETKMKLPSSQVVEMKSQAEVKFKPDQKSVSSNPNRSEARHPDERDTMNQITRTTNDKCCSAIVFETVGTSSDEDNEEPAYTNANFSPVTIEPAKTVVKMLPPLQFIDHWGRTTNEEAFLQNTGKSVRAIFLEATHLPRLSGGPLEKDYIFCELHFHWGRKDCCGADHVIDKKRHTMEAHFMYFKEEYGSFREAMTHEDGLAMVAVQFKVGGPSHPLFDQLVKDFFMIEEAEASVFVPAESLFSWIKQAVEESKGYFSYKSTMSEKPPFIEAVTWLIFDQPIVFCCQQSLKFRKLKAQSGELLLKTYRPLQPLNNRTIYYVPL